MPQVTLGPVDCMGDDSGLREGVEALPPSVTALQLLPFLLAEREGSAATAVWGLECVYDSRSPQGGTVRAYLELCAVFDQPGVRGGQGKPCGLGGAIVLEIKPPAAAAGREALSAYLRECENLAGRLQGGSGGVRLVLGVDLEGWLGVGAGEAGDGPDILGAKLGAVLPGAAPHVHFLNMNLCTTSGPLAPGTTRNLTAPGLAFPRLERLWLTTTNSIAAADVAALAGLVAPRLSHVLVYPHSWPAEGVAPPCPILELAMGLPRPVDAAGRPADLAIYVMRTAGSAPPIVEGINSALAAAGRVWVRVSLC